MLTHEDNAFLTQTGPGTPMGELWRRFWLPALLPGELPEPDCAPVRIRLLSEELVAFRDSSGRVAFMQNACPHRGASMFFGRNEEDGLRCVYHGWKFDVTGACVDMPNEPAESNFKHKIQATTYPGADWGGLIWVYMGPKHLSPQLPQLQWCILPDNQRYVDKWLQNCNSTQAHEGEIDTSHISFLHRTFEDPGAGPRRNVTSLALAALDGAPQLTVKETEYGFVYGARRTTPDGNYYWRCTQFLLPNYSIIAGGNGGRCWIPMDDEHCWVFAYTCNPQAPMSEDELRPYKTGASGYARKIPGTFHTLMNAGNDYGIDRDMQHTKNFTGIWGVRDQDLAVVESMGGVYDRTKERLGTADTAIIAARRMLIRYARELQQGKEPYAASHGEAYRVRGLGLIDREGDLGALLANHREGMKVTG